MLRGTPLLVSTAAVILLQICLGVSSLIVRPSTAIARLVQRTQKSFKRIVMSGGDRQDAEVIVVGSCNMDLMTYTPRLPSRGERAANSFGASVQRAGIFKIWKHVLFVQVSHVGSESTYI